MSGPHRCSRFRHLILDISGLEFETTNGRRHPRDRIVEGRGFPLIRSSTASSSVRLPIPGHLLSDKHPTLHKTKEAADLWIARPDGRKWEEQNLAKYNNASIAD